MGFSGELGLPRWSQQQQEGQNPASGDSVYRGNTAIFLRLLLPSLQDEISTPFLFHS